MKTTKILNAGIAAALALTGGVAIADTVEQRRDVPAFTEVSLNGGMDATIQAGERQSVTVITDEDFQERVTTEVRDGKLIVKQKGNRWRNARVDLVITVDSLTGLYINGSSDVEATDVESAQFALEINGSGDVNIEGTCGESTLEINGSGDIDARSFECQSVSLDVNGSGDATIFASETVNVTVAGSGDVDIYGGGRIGRSRIAGSGDLRTH